jgi:hypothetical protein
MALKSGAMFGAPPAFAGPRGGRWLKAMCGVTQWVRGAGGSSDVCLAVARGRWIRRYHGEAARVLFHQDSVFTSLTLPQIANRSRMPSPASHEHCKAIDPLLHHLYCIAHIDDAKKRLPKPVFMQTSISNMPLFCLVSVDARVTPGQS